MSKTTISTLRIRSEMPCYKTALFIGKILPCALNKAVLTTQNNVFHYQFIEPKCKRATCKLVEYI